MTEEELEQRLAELEQRQLRWRAWARSVSMLVAAAFTLSVLAIWWIGTGEVGWLPW